MSKFQGPSKAVCVARNYLDHIKELNNETPASPIFFIKPATAISNFAKKIQLPKDLGELHYELELAVLIGKDLKDANPEEAKKAVVGYGLGIDLTLRDLQQTLKEKGHPWDAAKGFDHSLPLTRFYAPSEFEDPQNIMIELKINGETRQKDSTNLMLTPNFELIAAASKHFTLKAGDVVLAGTPKGVGPLQAGDKLEASLAEKYHFTTEVAE